MKKTLFMLFFISLVSFAFAQVPSWLQNKERDFPTSRFISAIGLGVTRGNAEIDAMRGIALFFKSSLVSEQELIKLYEQISLNIARNKSIQETRRQTILNQTVGIRTEVELRGIRFTSHYYNEGNRMWTVLVYIDKQEAERIYQNRIVANRSVITSLVSLYEEEIELLYKYVYLRIAESIAQLIEEDIRALAYISSARPSIEIMEYIQRIIALVNQARSQIVFNVTITGDRNNRISRKISELLGKQKYIASPNSIVYTHTILGNISFVEETISAPGAFTRITGIGVHSGISLQLVNKEGLHLFPYNRNYPRAAELNKEAAYNVAFRDIEEDLEKNFITEFNAFIGIR